MRKERRPLDLYNYFMLIGYVAYDLEIKETPIGTKVVDIFLKIRRSFKNQEGEYTCDIVKVSVWEALADYAVETFSKGSKVILKGRVKPNKVTLSTGATITVNELFADKIINFDDYPFDFDEIDKDENKEMKAE